MRKVLHKRYLGNPSSPQNDGFVCHHFCISICSSITTESCLGWVSRWDPLGWFWGPLGTIVADKKYQQKLSGQKSCNTPRQLPAAPGSDPSVSLKEQFQDWRTGNQPMMQHSTGALQTQWWMCITPKPICVPCGGP